MPEGFQKFLKKTRKAASKDEPDKKGKKDDKKGKE